MSKYNETEFIKLDSFYTKDIIYGWIHGTGGVLFRQKLSRWANIMGVHFNRACVKDLSSRWGSCSSNKNLNFCWKIFLLPESLADYIMVHELAHLRYLNHSQKFWDMVSTYIPDYKQMRNELKKYI